MASLYTCISYALKLLEICKTRVGGTGISCQGPSGFTLFDPCRLRLSTCYTKPYKRTNQYTSNLVEEHLFPEYSEAFAFLSLAHSLTGSCSTPSQVTSQATGISHYYRLLIVSSNICHASHQLKATGPSQTPLSCCAMPCYPVPYWWKHDSNHPTILTFHQCLCSCHDCISSLILQRDSCPALPCRAGLC